MRRPAALFFICIAVATAACGSGAPASGPASARQPTDPRSVPTATVPAVLPSPIPAGPVTNVNVNSASTAPSVYDVKSGDTLAAIAQQLGVPLSDLESYNSDVNPSTLKIGQELKVPPQAATATPSATPGRTATPPTAITVRPSTAVVGAATASTARPGVGSAQSYGVQAGDTACKIAGNFKVSLQELAEANGTTPSGMGSLKVGQQIKIPAPTGSPQGC